MSPGKAHINLGTGGFILAPIHDLESIQQHQEMPLLISLASSNGHHADYVLEGTINGAGSTIKWAAKQLGLESVERNLDSWAKQVTDPPLFFNSVDDSDSLILDAIGTAYSDANLDGSVNGQDFVAWNTNKFKPGVWGWADGDFNGDGAVNGQDFVIWNQNRFGGQGNVAVPEPNCAVLASLAILAFGRLCRKRTLAKLG